MEEFRLFASLGASAAQVRRTVGCIRRFSSSAAAAGTGWARQLTRAGISRHLATMLAGGASAKTVRNHHAAISTFCNFLADAGALPGNPAAGLVLPRIPKRVPNFLDEDDLAEALRLAAGARIGNEVALAVNTGLRMSELQRLAWADVNLEARVLLVRVAKGGQPRQVPLNEAAIAALTNQARRTGRHAYVFPGGRVTRSGQAGRGTWDRGGPRGRDWWLSALAPLQEAIPAFRLARKGSTGRGWHLLRHTFASRLAQAGVDLKIIGEWMGHRSVTTTEIYAHLQPCYDRRIELCATKSEGETHDPVQMSLW